MHLVKRAIPAAGLATLMMAAGLAPISGASSAPDAPPAADVSADAAARPSGCSQYFGTVNERTRYITSSDPLGATLHDMSEPPVCAASGPYLGTASIGSTFRLYYADPRSSFWCYGYSPSLQRHGYVMCSQLKTSR